MLQRCVGQFSCTSNVYYNLYAGCKHCAPTTLVRGGVTAAQDSHGQKPGEMPSEAQKKEHISIYRVVAFPKGTQILHVLCLLWLFTMTDNAKVPD